MGTQNAQGQFLNPNPYGYYDPYARTGSAYVQTTAVPSSTGKGPMDYLNKLGKQAESMAGNLWGHVKVANSVPDTAWGRLTHGTNLLRKGGFEGVYKESFGLAPNEILKKTYACHLSTSNGAVAGTLYLTNQKFAFCSDRPVSYTPTPGQMASSIYKVIIPLDKVREVVPASNVNKPSDKYVQVVTVDNHEFWFIGFVNYEKGLKNMQEAVRSRSQNYNTGATPPPPPGYPNAAAYGTTGSGPYNNASPPPPSYNNSSSYPPAQQATPSTYPPNEQGWRPAPKGQTSSKNQSAWK